MTGSLSSRSTDPGKQYSETSRKYRIPERDVEESQVEAEAVARIGKQYLEKYRDPYNCR